MSEVSDWSTTDANNNATPPNGWPEGMQYSQVNNTGRAMMGAIARWRDQLITSGSFTGTLTGGTTSPTVTVSWYRIGNFVHISIPAKEFSSNATTFTITGGPSSLGNSSDWADSGQAASTPFLAESNGAFVTGVAYVNTNGTIVLILSNGASSSWGNSGYKGIGLSVFLSLPVTGVSFSYVIA